MFTARRPIPVRQATTPRTATTTISGIGGINSPNFKSGWALAQLGSCYRYFEIVDLGFWMVERADLGAV
jgi:hypothetical protein